MDKVLGDFLGAALDRRIVALVVALTGTLAGDLDWQLVAGGLGGGDSLDLWVNIAIAFELGSKLQSFVWGDELLFARIDKLPLGVVIDESILAAIEEVL